MCTRVRAAGCIFFCGLIVAMLQSAIVSAQQEAEQRPGKMETMENAADALCERAAVSRGIALNAVENAAAFQDAAEAEVMGALRAGNAEAIETARKALRQAWTDAEEAREVAVKVLEYASAAESAAKAAKEEIARLSEPLNEKEVAAAIKKAERLLHVAEEEVQKAESLSEGLKKKWLIPKISEPLTRTSVEKRPDRPSATPVGRR